MCAYISNDDCICSDNSKRFKKQTVTDKWSDRRGKRGKKGIRNAKIWNNENSGKLKK